MINSSSPSTCLTHQKWNAGRFCFDLHLRPLIMGIVNVTPDSFSDGNPHLTAEAAISHGELLLKQGADMLDIGGESTRPGAHPVEAETEWQRIGPLVTHFAAQNVCVSVDTMKPEIMQRALDHGADIINDVMALQAPGAVDVVRKSQCGLILMHMQGKPATMQIAPRYQELVDEVKSFLTQRVLTLQEAGVERSRLVVDPGFGFGKSLEHNLKLLRALGQLAKIAPVLAGISRKSMLGSVTGQPVHKRLVASVTAAVLAVQAGAKIVRVHDVEATVDALKVLAAVQSA